MTFNRIQKTIMQKKSWILQPALKVSELEETTKNPDKKRFWTCLKSMNDTHKENDDAPLISEEEWLRHFQSLHSNTP